MKQIIIHYGELSTKGKNRKMFQRKLAEQIRHLTKHLEAVKVQPEFDYMYVKWNETPYETMIDILKVVPGISRFEPVYQVEKDLEIIKEKALELFSELIIKKGETFKVIAKRQDKEFPYDSYAIQREIGHTIGEQYPELGVEMKQPTHKLTISVHKDRDAYLSLHSYQGIGGMPYGSSGKGMLMLSGGFDSPIAGYLMMKRGLEIEAVHFSSPPYTSPQALEKTKKLTSVLTKYGLPMKFHNVPFAKIQEAIRDHVPDQASMTVMRRMMLRIMDELLINNKAQAIVNGESLGQVASQTIDSMVVINEVTTTPILRPLIAMDKTEIIELAEKVGTYNISVEPYDDCCTVFAPVAPHTKPKLASIEEMEKKLNIDALVADAIANTTVEVIDTDYLERQHVIFSDLL